MKIILGLLVFFIFESSAFANTCSNSYNNCVGRQAIRKFLGSQAVCVMEAECDTYCGQMFTGRKTVDLYCGMTGEYSCMTVPDCVADNTTIQRSEINLLTNAPNPGADKCINNYKPRSGGVYQ